jgi:hypothetical protein
MVPAEPSYSVTAPADSTGSPVSEDDRKGSTVLTITTCWRDSFLTNMFLLLTAGPQLQHARYEDSQGNDGSPKASKKDHEGGANNRKEQAEPTGLCD